MADASARLLDGVRRKVHSRQAGLAGKLKGKYVRRGGVKFLVVSSKGDTITVSDTKTEVSQVIRFRLSSFLSKKVTILDGGE